MFSSKLYLRFIFRRSRFQSADPQTIFWSETAISNPEAIAIFQGNVTSNSMCSGKAQITFLYFDTQPLLYTVVSIAWALQQSSQSILCSRPRTQNYPRRTGPPSIYIEI